MYFLHKILVWHTRDRYNFHEPFTTAVKTFLTHFLRELGCLGLLLVFGAGFDLVRCRSGKAFLFLFRFFFWNVHLPPVKEFLTFSFRRTNSGEILLRWGTRFILVRVLCLFLLILFMFPSCRYSVYLILLLFDIQWVHGCVNERAYVCVWFLLFILFTPFCFWCLNVLAHLFCACVFVWISSFCCDYFLFCFCTAI